MDNKEILDLINLFEKSSLSKFKMDRGDFSLTLEKGIPAAAVQVPAQNLQAMQPAQTVQPVQTSETADAAPATAVSSEDNSRLIPVKAPLVGVFYAAPSPDDLPYVKVGDKVEKGQVLCLVEAMKMMNELKAPESGIIRTVKGINGQLVEFDQILFEVEPC